MSKYCNLLCPGHRKLGHILYVGTLPAVRVSVCAAQLATDPDYRPSYTSIGIYRCVYTIASSSMNLQLFYEPPALL